MTSFTPWTGLAGGMLIGIAALLMLSLNGRIAGISGIVSGLLPPWSSDVGWRFMFALGLVGGALAWRFFSGSPLPVSLQSEWPGIIMAGLLVGFGTRVGGGCTSGHGVCGIARFSRRSLVATAIFMVAAFITTFIARHVIGA